ncbi:MAG: hypothetical protein ACRC24_04910 [Vibrionaceae bacterium]
MRKPSQRTFNNMLIASVLIAIALFNLPTYLNSMYGKNAESPSAAAQVIALLPAASQPDAKTDPKADIVALHFAQLTLVKKQANWQTSKPLSVAPDELAKRWFELQGTLLEPQVVQSLQATLTDPQTVKVANRQHPPYELTVYQLPSFWVMRNWQGEWLAVTVEKEYLFPFL